MEHFEDIFANFSRNAELSAEAKQGSFDFQGLIRKVDDTQRNIYIVAGTLGGVSFVLIIALIVLLYMIVQLKKQIQDMELQKRLEDEMNAQKLQAYTGEEMHRKLMAKTGPTGPSTGPARGGPDSEYAFNAPYVENRMLGQGNQMGGGMSRFPRY